MNIKGTPLDKTSWIPWF